MTDEDFSRYYVHQIQSFERYTTAEFLNPHNPLWPQQAFDYPYGQAPEVDDLPPEELADWAKYVGAHYLDAATGSGDTSPYASVVAQFGVSNFKYADLSDALFTEMVCEGVFSKLLRDLDDGDYARFAPLGVTRSDPQQDPYLKIDLSCMQIVAPYNGEFVAPTVVVVRRKTDQSSRWMHHWEGGYELVGIDIWQTNRSELAKPLSPPAAGAPADEAEAWRRSKYFVLQGGLHRIILIDHVLVHFPYDTINAITKSVLPTWHPLHQLLMPHFWLSLPVNNSVLEGDLSLVNRDTWYPWSPFAAKGDEIRKLLPLSWKGWEYYFPKPRDPKPADPPYAPNTSYPPYSFCVDPTCPPDKPKPAAVEPSEYRRLQNELYGYTRDFVRDVLKAAALAPPTDGKPNLAWLEVERWAHEIARFLPGFPNEDTIGDPDVLASAVATVIWNASVVNSFDHGALHTMMNDGSRPMPFVMRVPTGAATETVGDVLDAFGKHEPEANALQPLSALLGPPFQFLVTAVQNKLLQKYPGLGFLSAGLLESTLTSMPIPAAFLPLASPADLLFGKMADLLFFAPHNSTLLYDCTLPSGADGAAPLYAFLDPHPSFPDRFQLTPDQHNDLVDACSTFRQRLIAFDAPAGVPQPQLDVRARNGVPYVRPPATPPDPTKPWTDADKQAFRVRRCIAAGIQY